MNTSNVFTPPVWFTDATHAPTALVGMLFISGVTTGSSISTPVTSSVTR